MVNDVPVHQCVIERIIAIITVNLKKMYALAMKEFSGAWRWQSSIGSRHRFLQLPTSLPRISFLKMIKVELSCYCLQHGLVYSPVFHDINPFAFR